MKQQVETDSPLMRKLIREYIPQANEHCQNQFVRYYELLIDYNNRMNLTAITDPFGIVQRHFADSLLGEKLIPNGSKCIDVGTGAGFPGIPLAVMFPDVRFTLCDSVGKKTIVAREIANMLGLDNVEIVNARAESLPGKFDFIVSRAVASLTDFYPWVKGKYSRSILYLKGGDINEEICDLMSRERLRKGSVSTWPVSQWLSDPHFAGKFVIDISR